MNLMGEILRCIRVIKVATSLQPAVYKNPSALDERVGRAIHKASD